MEQDVRVQGDLIEFLRLFKCEACQNRDRKCLLQINDERCMLCSDADRQCVFSRTVQIRGPKKAFEWRTLLGTETVIGAKLNGHTDSSSNGTTSNIGQPERLPEYAGRNESVYQDLAIDTKDVPDVSNYHGGQSVERQGEPSISNSFNPVNARVSPNHVKTLPIGPRPLRPALGPRYSDFDVEQSLKRSRTSDPDPREYAAKIRKTGACDECRSRKLKCHHAILIDASPTMDEKPNFEPRPNPTTPDVSMAQQEPRRSLGNGTKAEAETPQSTRRTPVSKAYQSSTKPYLCSEPDCPRIAGFSTRNDLDRHKRSVHRISSDSRYTTAYKCAGLNCAKPEKIWPRLDNFRSHCERMHGKEDIPSILRRSEIDPITEESIYRTAAGVQIPVEALSMESAEVLSAYQASLNGSQVESPTSAGALAASASDSSVTCSICKLELKGKAIWLSGNLMRHIREKHTTIHRLRRCDLCGKQFSRNHNLYMHLSQVHQISRADADAHISREAEDQISRDLTNAANSNTYPPSQPNGSGIPTEAGPMPQDPRASTVSSTPAAEEPAAKLRSSSVTTRMQGAEPKPNEVQQAQPEEASASVKEQQVESDVDEGTIVVAGGMPSTPRNVETKEKRQD